MASLTLSANAIHILHAFYNLPGCDFHQQFLVYTTVDIPDSELEELCNTAIDAFARDMLSPREECLFLALAEKNTRQCNSLQSVLDTWMHTLEALLELARASDRIDVVKLYPQGFVVVTSREWRERGVTLVHCDEDEGSWEIGQCDIQVEHLGIPLSGLALCETEFSCVKSTALQQGVHGTQHAQPRASSPGRGAPPNGPASLATYSPGVREDANRL